MIRHDLHRASPLHRGCEYSTAFAFHGPKIPYRTVQNSVHSAVLCHSAATTRECNGSQLPITKGWYKPTGEGPTNATQLVRKVFTKSTYSRWNEDASELTSSWPSKCSKVKLTLTRLTSSSTHPEPGYESTPTDDCKGQAAFDAGTVLFRFGSLNTGTDCRHI